MLREDLDKKKGGDEEETSGLLWSMLRKFVTLIDELRDLGLQEHISLPRIAVLGTQSSGKSSVLESIVGLDFLPRGDGVVTRRPLELRLHHLQENTEPWAVFEEIPNKKFTNFFEVRKGIDEVTDKIAGSKKNIIDKPIALSVYSYTCPDLTLIDLPGITRIPLKDSDQPKDIERITTELAKKYCIDERTIILCVIPANVDLSTSEALKFAQEWDPQGVRTVGVLTKLDIMDKGTNAKRALMNQEISLKLGFVGVKNRSQADIQESVKVQRGLDSERAWFANHPIYSTLPKECYGTDTLTQKLSRIMYAHIRHNLPEIMKEVEAKLKDVEERIRDLGNPLPTTESEKMQLLWGMINNFVSSFRNKITGKYDTKNKTLQKKPEKEGQGPVELTGGAKIKEVFFMLYDEFIKSDYKCTANLQDKDIERAIILHEGDNLSGFPSVDVFYYLIQPEIEKLKEPANRCLWAVYDFLEELAHTIVEKTFMRFPSMIGELMAVVQSIMGEERDKTKYIVESLIDSEIGYMFTNDTDYLGKRTDIIPKTESREKDLMMEPLRLYVNEMRMRIESYFKLVLRSVRDSVPKVIGCFLVRAIQEKMQLELATRLSKNEQIQAVLSEPPSIVEERKRLTETQGILKKALKVMQRDPDLNISSSSTEDELLQDLAKIKQESKKKVQEKAEKTKKGAASMFGEEGSKKVQQNLFGS